MLESERKEWNKYKWFMAIITVALLLTTYAGLFHFDIYYYQKATSKLWSGVGAVLLIASFIPLIFERKISRRFRSEDIWYIVWFVCIGLGLLLACSSEL